MPIRTRWHHAHDFSLVGLDCIEVGDSQPKEQATQAVIDARNERLVVLALFGASNDVGLIREDRLDKPRNLLGQELQIGGIEHEDAATGHLPSRA